VPACGDTLDQETYLQGDLSATGNCFNIGAASIKINCQGHTISGDGTGFGIYNPGFDSVRVENCIISGFSKAIYYQNNSDSALFINDTAKSSVDGFYIDNSSKVDIWNCTASANTGAGIVLNTSGWGSISNTSVVMGGPYGINLYRANFSYIDNTSITVSGVIIPPSSYFQGILVNETNSSTITNITFNGQGIGRCIHLVNSNMTRIENSSLNLCGQGGMFINLSNYTFVYNCTVFNSTYASILDATPSAGIALYSSLWNLFQNLTIWNNTGPGMSFTLSDNNSVQNVSLQRNGQNSQNQLGGGIYLNSSNNNTFWNVTDTDQLVWKFTNGGVILANSNDNDFFNVSLSNNSYGFYFLTSDRNLLLNSSAYNSTWAVWFAAGSDNNIIANSSLLTVSQTSVWLNDAGDNNTLLNTTFDKYNISMSAYTGFLRVQWYARLETLDYAAGNLTGAYFNVSNNTFSILYSNLTEGQGDHPRYSNWSVVEEGVQTVAGFFSEGNHTFNVSLSGYSSNYTNASINESKTVTVYLKILPIDLSFTMNYPPTGCHSNQGNSSVSDPASCDATFTCVCDQGYFKTNSSATYTPAGLTNQNCTSPQGQTATFAFLNFTNTGNVPFNWTLDTALPSTHWLIFNQTGDVGPLCTASTMKILTKPSYSVVNDSVQVGISAFAWIYGNFTDASIGTVTTDLNTTSCQALSGCP
jgi:parallel beta-helix repeat protein